MGVGAGWRCAMIKEGSGTTNITHTEIGYTLEDLDTIYRGPAMDKGPILGVPCTGDILQL